MFKNFNKLVIQQNSLLKDEILQDIEPKEDVLAKYVETSEEKEKKSETYVPDVN